MNNPSDLPMHAVDFNEENSNTTQNPTFDTILQARLSRRGLLRGGVGTFGTAMLGALGLSACGGGDDEVAAPAENLLAFTAVSKSLADAVAVPAGYTAHQRYGARPPGRQP